MVVQRRANVTDGELMFGILRTIWAMGEVKESDLYPLVGNRGRIRPVLDHMCSSHLLSTRLRERGQRVPMYSYTDKGRLYCMCWFLASDLTTVEGEMDMESGEFREIYALLSNRYGPADAKHN